MSGTFSLLGALFFSQALEIPEGAHASDLAFVQNRGQWATAAEFVTVVPTGRLWIEQNVLAFDAAVSGSDGRSMRTLVRLVFEGAREGVSRGVGRLPGEQSCDQNIARSHQNFRHRRMRCAE